MGLKKPSSSCGRIRLAAIVAIVCVVAVGCAIGWVIAADGGSDDGIACFGLDGTFDIARTAPDGTAYTVNNSTATFSLDVLADDEHCGRLFRDYASAMAYCRQEGLATIPSVQVVQGKCKQFDDGLCAALELALQRGRRGGRMGKRAALVKLLADLLAMADDAGVSGRRFVEAAAVHVATALSLGGGGVDLPEGLAAKVEEAKKEFLARSAEAKPVGFWTWSPALRETFQQDRYLSCGMKLEKGTGVCVVLAVAISRDAELAEAFARFRRLGAKLTNPPVYVEPGRVYAPQAPCVGFEAVRAVVPADTPLAEALADETIAKVRADLHRRHGTEAGFALIPWARSKEYALLHKLGSRGEMPKNMMQAVIDAVRSGRLQLKPRAESGWYDYQWYAMETLLLPGRARESPKLHLSDAYKRRWENAFRTSLTKHRETHIKRLPPQLLLAKSEKPFRPKVRIGPQLSAEPTPTVYLRYARAYRFLRNAIHAVMGDGFLAGLHRPHVDGPADLETELREMMLLCYGLYERLCLEIGQPPSYMPREMTDADVASAGAHARRWLDGLADDRDLAKDTRVAVAVACDPLRRRRWYWATGGVRLQRVKYAYREKPTVSDEVEAEFVPSVYYLPTDIFVEFIRRNDSPLTRAEFRELCDGHDDEASLCAALGAAPPLSGGSWLSGEAVRVAVWIVGAIVLVVLAYRFRTALVVFWRWRRRVRRRWIALGAAVLIVLWIGAMLIFPRYRTRVIVKYVARIHTKVAVCLEARFYGNASPEQIDALVNLLSDPSPQVRYLAARYLGTAWTYDEAYTKIPGLQRRLHEAAEDEIVDVADCAVGVLGSFKTDENVDFLLRKLDCWRNVDGLCWRAVWALGRVGDPRTLDAILPLTDDPRPPVCNEAILALGNIRHARSAQRLAELVQSDRQPISGSALRAIDDLLSSASAAPWERQLNTAMLVAARNTAYSPEHRGDLAEKITQTDTKVEAYLAILKSPSSSEETSSVACQAEAAEALGGLGAAAAAAVDALKEAAQSDAPELRDAADKALQQIQP